MHRECSWCWGHPTIKDGMRVKMCNCSAFKWNKAQKNAKSNKHHNSTKMKLEHREGRLHKERNKFN